MAYQTKHYDDQSAKAEGWALFSVDGIWWGIQKLDEAEARFDPLTRQSLPPFDWDIEAQEFVRNMADAGSRPHREAWALHARRIAEVPDDFDPEARQ